MFVHLSQLKARSGLITCSSQANGVWGGLLIQLISEPLQNLQPHSALAGQSLRSGPPTELVPKKLVCKSSLNVSKLCDFEQKDLSQNYFHFRLTDINRAKFLQHLINLIGNNVEQKDFI